MMCLARAHKTFISLDMPFEAARCLLEQAEAWVDGSEASYQGTGDKGQRTVPCPPLPVRCAHESLVVFERLDGQRYAERVRQLLRRIGASSLFSRRQRLGCAFLSERELEIARLVAQGLTNRGIAGHLIISPGTVERHLHRIYARLGIGSRTALARLVIEAGLLSS